MKYIYLLFILFCNSLYGQKITNYITIKPGDCPNCFIATDLVSDCHNIFVIQKAYEIDSALIIKNYPFLKNKSVIYSDSLFNERSINGQMTISNKDNTLRCLLPEFSKEVFRNYIKWEQKLKETDTINYSYPIGKVSIKKRLFNNDGKLFLLNSLENNILVFDILKDKFLDTISIPEIATKKAYSIFGGNDEKAFDFYKSLIEPHINDPLSSIQDIAIQGNNIFISTSNYFFFVGGKEGNDTFLTHFQAIHKYNYKKYEDTYVPVTIKQIFLDTSIQFYTENSSLYYFDNLIYTDIVNSRNNKSKTQFIIGSYSPNGEKVNPVIPLDKEFLGDKNFSNAIYDNGNCLISKSTKLYNLNSKNSIDLDYFQQKIEDGIFPEFYNTDLKMDKEYIEILYRKRSENESLYYVRINRKTNKIIKNKLQNHLNTESFTEFDPFNSGYIIQLNNNEIIRYKIKE